MGEGDLAAEGGAWSEGSPSDLVGALAAAVARWPNKVAWRFDPGEALTFAQIERRVGSYAGALAASGVRRGDRVAVMIGNQAAFPLTWFALVRLGAVMVPLNIRYRSTDVGHLLGLARVRFAVVEAQHEALLRGAPTPPEVIGIDLLRNYAGQPVAAGPLRPEDTVNVQPTSGTTGRPKGCLLSHDYWITLGRGMVEEFPHLTAEDVMLTAQPFSYIDPQWNVVAALMCGAELVVLDGFHPSSFWAKVREHRVTFFYCLGAMPTLLLRMPADPLDREHRVRVVQCSAIPPRLHAELEQRWRAPWFETFGMTETGGDIRVSAADHDAMVGTGGIGRPTTYREVKLGPDGELLLRGRGMMDGYVDDQAATAAAFADGWFHTGDLAQLDDHGMVRLVGRKKDMIRRSGENVAAREVEDVLLTHPAVRIAAVVGVPDELRGEEVRAYVVAADVDIDELVRFTTDRLAGFKVPRYWSVHADLERTPSERVRKSRLPALAGPVFDRVEGRWK